MADRIGRRPVLIMGLFGTAISATVFGFAPTFWVAVFGRFLWGMCCMCSCVICIEMMFCFGFVSSSCCCFRDHITGLLNANIGIAKTYMSEICDDTNSAKGMVKSSQQPVHSSLLALPIVPPSLFSPSHSLLLPSFLIDTTQFR